MKKLLLFAALLVTALSFSQVGIGTTTPKASAQLDVTSTNKGFLPPRLTYDQKTAIDSPVAGLLIWCSDCGTNGESQVYNGTTWTNISGTTASFAKPGAPTISGATASNAKATVSFDTASNGGSAILDYTVTSTPEGLTATGATTSLTVLGLTNGISYTFTVVARNAAGTSSASVASGAVTPFTVPGAPTISTATAIYKQATVFFTAPESNGSAITGYTVTSSPEGLTATGATFPLTVLGLTNGISYTFTVVATNAAGNSVASSASTAVIPNCGAYVSAGVYKVFACYNLGATDTTVDPNTPVQVISGNYYQWGKSTPVATATTYSASISGWSTTPATDGAWGETKTANDPCPDGFKVPTNTQLAGVWSLNTITRTGTWAENFSNWSTAIHFGTETVKTLTLPAQGYRNNSGGTLHARALTGVYWASTTNGSGGNPYHLYFYVSDYGSGVLIATTRLLGFSVRCVSQ